MLTQTYPVLDPVQVSTSTQTRHSFNGWIARQMRWGSYLLVLFLALILYPQSAYSQSSVTLHEPLGHAIFGKQTFSWSVHSLELKENQAYSVVFWDPKLGETPLEDGYAPTGYVSSTSATIDLDEAIRKIPEIEEKRYYHWGIVLLQTHDPFKRLAYLGGDHKFWLTKSPVTPTPMPTNPVTRIVAPNGGDFRSIQKAIDSVPAGSTIRIVEGIYRENIKIRKTIHLIGIGDRDDIVIHVKAGDAIYFNGGSGTLRNLTIRSESETDDAIHIVGGQLVVEKCNITSQFKAIHISNGANPTIRGNRIYDNGIGISIAGSSSGLFEDNRIFRNGIGVNILGGSNPTIRNNQVSWSGSGILFAESSQGIVEGNTVDLSATGILVGGGSSPNVAFNKVNNNVSIGIWIVGKSRGAFENNDIYSNGTTGMVVELDSIPTVRDNRISQNGKWGISIGSGAGGTYTDNYLVGNDLGPWEIKSDAGVIYASGNTPYNP